MKFEFISFDNLSRHTLEIADATNSAFLTYDFRIHPKYIWLGTSSDYLDFSADGIIWRPDDLDENGKLRLTAKVRNYFDRLIKLKTFW